MNNQLLEKLIKFDSETCPEFVSKNPLVQREVASSLSKSFVKILNLSNQNTNVNNNIRHTILENIRKLCVNEPENHHKIDDNFTELLTKFYEMHLNEINENDHISIEKQLDAFLVRKLKEIDIISTFTSAVNPEIVQALVNLSDSGNGSPSADISNDIIHWNNRNSLCRSLLIDLWKDNSTNDQTKDDISIKMRVEIEKLLLETCFKILNNEVTLEEAISTNANLLELVKSCSKSPQCFQISCGIVNFLLIMTNYDAKLRAFISDFVDNIKRNCPDMKFFTLYPLHLTNTVILLDINIIEMPEEMKQKYSELAWSYFSDLQKKSENEFVMLLSHFPQWFDIFFANQF